VFLKFGVREDVFFHHRLGLNRGSFSVFPFPGSEYSLVIYDTQERITASVVGSGHNPSPGPEQRALQKVSETKDRAKEILEIKRKKEQHENEKQAKNISREMAIKEAQQRTIMEREARKKRIASSKKVRTRSTPDHFQQAACTKLILNHNLPSSCTTAN